MAREDEGKVIPLFGKDEMNLIEFPFGPITSTGVNTLEVEHEVWDRRRKRHVTRLLVITGSGKFGLPRPIDDNVLVGLKALTYEARFESRRVHFSRYRLCQTIGWEPDGRSYVRLEESLDRIAGTTLKFKDCWYDKGEKEFLSKTFHLIGDVELCSRDRLEGKRAQTGQREQKLCSFEWSDVIWKSFQDGFIRTLDMRVFRRISQGHRREVPLRLFRILDKRFYHSQICKFDVRKLCVGTLGLSSGYSPSQLVRILDRAGRWLVECEYLEEMWYGGSGNQLDVYFKQRKKQSGGKPRIVARTESPRREAEAERDDALKIWLSSQNEIELLSLETKALEGEYGSKLERKVISDERLAGVPVQNGGRLRQEYVRRFASDFQEVRLVAANEFNRPK